MMPPKKSKAARSVHQETQEVAKSEEPKKEEVAPCPAPPKEVDPEEEEADVNIFKVEIVEGKRSRSLPAGEQSLKEWMDVHLEDKDEFEIVMSDAYDNYVSSCVAAGAFAATQYEFMKGVKDKFPNGAGIKQSSPYDGLIRVKKPKKERSDKDKATKVKADSLKLKMKDIVSSAIEDLGNPHKGVQFNKLKLHIAGKFPALRMEQKPRLLLSYMERSVQFGHLERVKGVGMCGYFRLFGPSKSDDEEDKENKEEKGMKEEEPENTSDKDAEKPTEQDGEADTEATELAQDGEVKKEAMAPGEIKEEGEEDDEEAKVEADDGKRKTRKRKAPAKGKSKAKGKKKSGREWKKYRQFVVHSDPERIEDAFSLAMTFMVEPKEASARKILKYINDYYDRNLSKDKLRTCLENGCDKGYWEQVTGQGFSGTFRLIMDEFDPTADDDLIGKVTNALVACTEPKQCSAVLLKSYMLEYHKDRFDITNKPHIFKKALERGLHKDIIRQLSGIGATGSFQLSEVFTPTPVILRGEDEESDYASNTEPESDSSEEEEHQGYGPFHISTFQDAYNPRPTKRHGHGRVASTALPEQSRQAKSGGLRTSQTSNRNSKARTQPKKSIYREDTDSEDEAPSHRRRKAGRQSPRKTKKKSYKEAIEAIESDDDEKLPVSRRARKQESSNEEDVDSEEAPPPKRNRAPAKKTPAKKGRGSVVKASSRNKQESDNDQSEDESPAPKKGRRNSSPKATVSLKKSQKESSDEADVDSEEEPQTPRKGGRNTPKRKATPIKSQRESSSEDEDSEEFSPIRSQKKGGRGTPSKKTPSKKSRSFSSGNESEEEVMPAKKDRQMPTEATPTPTPTKKATKKKGKGRRR